MKNNKIRYIHNLMFMYKQIFSVSKARIFLIVLQCIISVLNMIIDIYFVKYIIDGLIAGYKYNYFIFVVAIKLGSLLLFQCCDNIFSNYIYKKIDIKIQRELSLRLFNNIKRIKLRKISDPEFYDKYTKAISEVSSRSEALLGYFAWSLSTFLNIFSLIAIIAATNPVLIILAIIGMAVTVWANVANTKNVYNADMSFVKVNRKIDYIRRLFYQPQYVKDIRRTHLSDMLNDSYYAATDEKQQLVKKHWPKIIIIAISGSWFYNVVNVGAAYLYLTYKAIEGVVSIGDTTSLAYAVNQLSNTMLQISNIVPQGIQHALYIQNYIDMLEGINTEDIYLSEGKTEIKKAGDIKLTNVSFSYPGKNVNALDCISLTIKKGEHIAIVGENGAGKTTLVNLITALYEPYSGTVYMNGIPYNDLSFESLSSLIAVVDQDFQHYAFTISENIALQSDVRNINNEKIKEALENVNMYELISGLNHGTSTIYSTEFDSNGVEFSGGQLQRLAIARAVYANSQILIMDEPSSALDPINEQKMFDTIYKISEGKTLIVISHRLSCVKDADRIIVMDNGKIAEIGNHNELMNLNGKYAMMFKIQGKRYSSN